MIVSTRWVSQRSMTSSIRTLPSPRMQNIMKELSTIRLVHEETHVNGDIDSEFKLTITRPGCEFDGFIYPEARGDEQNKTLIRSLLEKWYKHGVVSGFGDVRSQETKVDSKVRDAREIPASEFSVEPQLLQEIQEIWGRWFFPGVRAQPYKIHIYGPEGCFKAHRDTPQKDLVGTFLLGLGDTTQSQCFQIGKQHMAAHPGSWVAFYPDVPHSVKHVWRGHRAVIAFKIFRDVQATAPAADFSSTIHRLVKNATDKMRAPAGVLLERKYCVGTTNLSGFDAVVLDCLMARTDIRVHPLPIVMSFHADWPDTEHERKGSWSAKVYPFTDAHIDVLLEKDNEEHKKERERFKAVRDVPFYYSNFEECTMTWSSEEEQYRGNEAYPGREDSIYVSYALLVLPAK